MVFEQEAQGVARDPMRSMTTALFPSQIQEACTWASDMGARGSGPAWNTASREEFAFLWSGEAWLETSQHASSLAGRVETPA
ncbi:hypothetical protein FRB95_012778 [Tulasnella sp. JGI-2019a]|nr:hypothetical protein FRB93_004721 [Tulasnella sp. JGI-2019a]KAG9039067.1 hypothetical protein FRB95_012778 [Tulasnella sp. JGI-2019a]